MFVMRASGATASWVVGQMGTDAHLYDDPEDAAIPALLDSRFDADKVDVAHLFPQVPFAKLKPHASCGTNRGIQQQQQLPGERRPLGPRNGLRQRLREALTSPRAVAVRRARTHGMHTSSPSRRPILRFLGL